MKPRHRAYSYLRFSTPEQALGDSQRRQTRLAENYAAAHGLVLDDKLTFQDLGVSAYQGRNVETGQLGAFLDAVRSGLVERGSYLLVESLDRISRRTARKAARALEAICEEGITLVTLSDNREYTEESLDNDPLSFLMSVLIFMRANEESATKAKRLRAAWDGKRERLDTEKMTSRVPGWLWLDKETGTIKVHRERATVVRRIFRDTLKGVGKFSIARTLNDEGVPVFGRGGHWHRSYIAKILSSSTVIGTLTPHVFQYTKEGKKQRTPLDPVADYYPAVIDPEVFQRVQSLQQTATPLRGRHATGAIRNLFGGLARCPKCEGTMTRVYKGGGAKGGTYLACVSAKLGAGCTYRAVRYGPVEAALLKHAPGLLEKIPAGNTANAAKIDREIRNTESALLGLPDQIDNVVDAIARGHKKGVSSVALAERLRELEDELEPLRMRLETLRSEQADAAGVLVARKADELLEALEKGAEMDRSEANSLLRQVFAGVTVDYESGRLLFEWKHGGESTVPYAMPLGRPRKRPVQPSVRRRRSNTVTRRA